MHNFSDQMKPDILDRKILEELTANSRYSFREISRKLKVSIATVISRVNKLEKERIIKSYTTYVDHERLGYDITAIIKVDVVQGKTSEIEDKIAKHPNVCSVYHVTGESDVIIIAKFRNRRSLDDFIKKFMFMKYVDKTNTQIVLKTTKEDFTLPHM